jgi:uncharacterized protein involved in exopolysaccharide biosynthesis
MTKRQGHIQDQIRALQSSLQASPVVEQQLKELTRSYQTASDIYNDLLKKRENSAMATDLEHEQQGENFKVLDAPSLPSTRRFRKLCLWAEVSARGLRCRWGFFICLPSAQGNVFRRDVELSLSFRFDNGAEL